MQSFRISVYMAASVAGVDEKLLTVFISNLPGKIFFCGKNLFIARNFQDTGRYKVLNEYLLNGWCYFTSIASHCIYRNINILAGLEWSGSYLHLSTQSKTLVAPLYYGSFSNTNFSFSSKHLFPQPIYKEHAFLFKLASFHLLGLGFNFIYPKGLFLALPSVKQTIYLLLWIFYSFVSFIALNIM